MTKCVIISSQSLFLLEYSSKGLSNKCIYWVYLKTSKPRCARGNATHPSKVNTLKPNFVREKEKAEF